MKYITSIFFILFWANSFAQNNFYSSYDYINRNDFGLELIQDSKGKLMVAGMTTRGGASMKFLLLDSNGILTNQKHYNPSIDSDLYSLESLNDTIIVSTGSSYDPIEGAADCHLLFLKTNGDSLKTTYLDLQFNDRIHDLYVESDSVLIALGIYSDSSITDFKPFITRLDTSGYVLWFKTHNKSGYDETIKNLQPVPGGGYVFSGTEEETPNGHTDLFLTKVDSIGNLVWKQYYHEAFSQRGGHVEVLRDGNYAMFGTGYTPHNADRAILKIDQAGNLIWRKKHGTNLDEGYIVGKELPNGNFICAGTSIRTYNSMQIDDVNLSMLDSSGNLLWSRDYNYHGLGTNEYVKDLIITSDGGFAMTGFILNAPGNTGNDVFVLKTDTNGLITSLNSGFREVTPDMRVYPNPTKDVVNVPYIEGLERIDVYDLGGKLLSTSTPLRMTTTVEIPVKNGIYILKLVTKNGEVFSKKVIKD